METFIEGISKQCELKETEITLLRQALRTLHFPKGSTVIGEGKTDDSIYFIQKGVWRAYIERDGEQQTLWFSIPGETVFSSWSYFRGHPSRYTISSSSDSIAIEMRNSTIQKLSDSSPAFLKWMQELLVNILINEDDLLIDLSSPKAENRYLAFIKKMPELFNSVPLKEIAGYIGVTPQSLSRIRAGLNKNKKAIL
ncbi:MULTISPECIES: Crp/Fnr family transcriptional regulator [Parabacteroides]|uniref:Crp/Fnr family transcriptional regulator n=1 Tax=Parabacteroides TaxID=375288 RepID=UPI000F00630E|nr:MULTISPECIES: Crp/Fnr family transcriptional regulator [Parabacteroides]RHU25244.1 Crp/Fnr family transcriptional regulator [Parabacteroides sp. TM07-1AC]WFE85174.1 Crp/Fnr family transcriptional regulator [Parabacteroides chongii]